MFFKGLGLKKACVSTQAFFLYNTGLSYRIEISEII